MGRRFRGDAREEFRGPGDAAWRRLVPERLTSLQLIIGLLSPDRVGAVRFVDAHRACGAHAVRLQKHHDLPDGVLIGPAAR